MNCSLCGYELTSPACIGCLKKQILAFVKGRASMKEDVEISMSLFKHFNNNNSSCITCKSNVAICSFCVYSEIYRLLKKKNKELAEEFGSLFQCTEEIQDFLDHY